MTDPPSRPDEPRPELEWPAEDLQQAKARTSDEHDVDWPAEDQARGLQPEPPAHEPPTAAPSPAPEPPPLAPLAPLAPPPPLAPVEPPPLGPRPHEPPPLAPLPPAAPLTFAEHELPPPAVPLTFDEREPPSPVYVAPPDSPAGYELPPTYGAPHDPSAGYEQPPGYGTALFEMPPATGAYPPTPDLAPYAPTPAAGLYAPTPVAGPYAPTPGAGPYAPGPPPLRGAPPILTPAQAGPYSLAQTAGATPPSSAEGEQAKRYFRPDVEGLRAVAIIAVLLFHIGLPGASGGFIGVDVFYVISGFLITGLLLREGEGSGKVDLVNFYARRMRRLLPAALVVIVVTLAASALILTSLRLTEVAGDAAASALYVSNFRFALEATDYLAVGAPSPFLHFWSLGVEEQFYLFWPLILLVAVRLLGLRFVGWFIVVLAAASFALSLYWTDASPSWAFFSPVTRAWELAAGALLAVGLLRLPRRTPRIVASLAVWVGLALIVAGTIAITPETQFPGLAVLLPVSGAVLVILGGLGGPTLPGRLLSTRPARYLGRISYSLYLWHWPILILVPIAIETDTLAVRIALAGVAIFIAAASTELIEQPFRSGGFLIRRPGFSVQLGLLSSVAVGVAALLVGGMLTIPTPWTRPDPVVVELAGVREDLPQAYADGCHLGYQETEPADCVYGDPNGERTAFLFGDSHAAQWLPALDRYARQRGWRLEFHTKSSCSPVELELWERRLRRVYTECFEWRDAVKKRIRQQHPVAVFVGSSRDYEIWNDGTVAQTREVYPLWREGLRTALLEIAASADRVVLLAETPFLNFDPIDCLADPEVETCDPPTQIVIDREYADIEADAAAAAQATLLSINDLLCPGVVCPVVVDDTVVFRDQHHLTATFMAKLAEPIGNLLDGRPAYPSPAPTPGGPGGAGAASLSAAPSASPSAAASPQRSADPQ